MRHTPLTIRVLTDAFSGRSWPERAFLSAAYILSSASWTGGCSCAELRGVLGVSQAEFDVVYAELYEAGAVYVVDADELFTNLAHDLLPYAIGAPGRPRAKDWESLKRALFAEWFEHIEPHCMYCRETAVPLTLDHVVPIARGGSNHPHNFIAACYSCNSAKKDKTFAEFMAWRKAKGL